MSSFSPNDEIIKRILDKLPNSADLKACSLVNRRWYKICGERKTSIKLFDWKMLESGRLMERFPYLTAIDLSSTWANTTDPDVYGSTAVHMTRGVCSMKLDPDIGNPFAKSRLVDEQSVLPEIFDDVLQSLVDGYPNLRQLCVVDVYRVSKELRRRKRVQQIQNLENSSYYIRTPRPVSYAREGSGRHANGKHLVEYSEEYLERDAEGLEIVGEGCETLQEIEVRQCTDFSLKAMSSCKNLQVVSLVGALPGFYHATFTDRGLRTLARSCHRIIELTLNGGQVGYDGLAMVATECSMLSQLTLSGNRFKPRWVNALPLCRNLETLRFRNFVPPEQEYDIDGEQQLRFLSVERLEFFHCDLRAKNFLKSLLFACSSIQELGIINCWGLQIEDFFIASNCKRLKKLILEGCTNINTNSLQGVLLELHELQHLEVTNCRLIRDQEIKPALSNIMFSLKELKWKPRGPRLSASGLMSRGRWLLGSPLLTQLPTD